MYKVTIIFLINSNILILKYGIYREKTFLVGNLQHLPAVYIVVESLSHSQPTRSRLALNNILNMVCDAL